MGVYSPVPGISHIERFQSVTEYHISFDWWGTPTVTTYLLSSAHVAWPPVNAFAIQDTTRDNKESKNQQFSIFLLLSTTRFFQTLCVFITEKNARKVCSQSSKLPFPNWLAYWKYHGVEPGAVCIWVGVLVVDWGRGDTFKGSYDILIVGYSSP